jgi:hypothetical protein
MVLLYKGSVENRIHSFKLAFQSSTCHCIIYLKLLHDISRHSMIQIIEKYKGLQQKDLKILGSM